MTNPLGQMPSVQFGNVASDIGSAVSSFAKGLQDERARRREEAMTNALRALQMQRAMQPMRPFQERIQGPNGLEYAYADPMNPANVLHTGREAPNPNFISPYEDDQGNLVMGSTPRYGNNPQTTVVPNPSGIQPKDVPAIPQTTETPQGPQNVLVQPRSGVVRQPTLPGQNGQPGQPLVPKADEQDEKRAQRAFEMVHGDYEMREANKIDPQAYDDAARFAATIDVGSGVPIFGGLLEKFISQTQGNLSPAAQRYYNGLMQMAASVAFSNGGATLTQNEIRYALSSLAPKPMEDPTATAGRSRLLHGRVMVMTHGNNAWMRYRQMAQPFGWNDEEGSLVVPPPPPPSMPPNSYLIRQRQKRGQ